MCAPRKLLPVLAIGALAVATGGIGAGAAASAAGTSVAPMAAGQAGALADKAVHKIIINSFKSWFKYNTAAPLIGAGGLVYSGQVQKSILEQQHKHLSFKPHKKKKLTNLEKVKEKSISISTR